jgi:hypothetical protein
LSLDVAHIERDARAETNLDDTGRDDYREGLERLVESMNSEGDLTDMGEAMQHARLVALLAARLLVENTYSLHPEIDDEEIAGPVFVIGLSQLVAADPQFRSLRMWESGTPVPPPEKATEHTDPRIAIAEGNLALMNEAFPLMQTMHHIEATTATECQDLMGMSYRTAHFDGFARVPSYMDWVIDTDMRDVPVPPASTSPAPVALPTHPVAPKDSRAHVRPRRAGRCLSERSLPLEPSRSGQGIGIGLQPHSLHA